jgi:hypothetical protein
MEPSMNDELRPQTKDDQLRALNTLGSASEAHRNVKRVAK